MVLNFEFSWSPDIMSKTRFPRLGGYIRLAYFLATVPLHFFLVMFESWLDRLEWIPASLYNDHVVKVGWSRQQKLLFPIMKRIAALSGKLDNPPAWSISSHRDVPIYTIIYVKLQRFFFSAPFIQVKQEDLIISDSSKEWITGEAVDPNGQIHPVDISLFWFYPEPTAASKQEDLKLESSLDTCILYLVGGAYINGNPSEGSRCFDLVRATGYRVMGVQYRKPSLPSMLMNAFPAGLQDAIIAYRELCELGYKRIVIAGDSAGGGLSVTLMLYLAELSLSEKRPSSLILPAKLLLYSPWVDLTFSCVPNPCLDFVSITTLIYAVNLYVPTINPSTNKEKIQATSPAMIGAAHPLLSPALETSLPRLRLITQAYKGEEKKLKILVSYGEEELGKQQIILLLKNLKEVDLEVEVVVGPNAIHVYHMLPEFLEPSSPQNLMAVKRFLMEE